MNFQKSDTTSNLFQALAAAQGGFDKCVKDFLNPFFNSKYADLATVIGATRPAMSENGLSIIQIPSFDGAIVTVDTLLAHKSGEWLGGSMSARPSKVDPQGIGSCVTYLRRYAYSAIVGIAQEDDDGTAAAEPMKKEEKKSWADKPVEQPLPPEKPKAVKAVKAKEKLVEETVEYTPAPPVRVPPTAQPEFNAAKATDEAIASILKEFPDASDELKAMIEQFKMRELSRMALAAFRGAVVLAKKCNHTGDLSKLFANSKERTK